MNTVFFRLIIWLLFLTCTTFVSMAQDNPFGRTTTHRGAKHNTTGPQDDPRVVQAVAIPKGNCDTLFIATKTSCNTELIIESIKLHSVYDAKDYLVNVDLITDGIVHDHLDSTISYTRIPICIKSSISKQPYFVVEITFEQGLDTSACKVEMMHIPILITNSGIAKDTVISQSNHCFACQDKNNDLQLDDNSECIAKPDYSYNANTEKYEFRANATSSCFDSFYWIINFTDTTQGENVAISLPEWQYNTVDFVAYNQNTTCMKMAKQTILVKNNIGFFIYPNPSNDIVNIRANKLDFRPSYLLIHNVLGQLVYKKEISVQDNYVEEEIKVNSLSNGIHIITLADEKNKVSQKLIVYH